MHKWLLFTFFSITLSAVHSTKQTVKQRFNTLQNISHIELKRTPIIQKMISSSSSEFKRTVGYPQMPYPLQTLLLEQGQLEAMNWDCATFENHRSLYNISSIITGIRDHIHSQHHKQSIPQLFFILNPTSKLRNISKFHSSNPTEIVNLADIECEMEYRDFEGVLYPYRFINKSAHNLRDDIEFCKKNTIEHLEETFNIIKQTKSIHRSERLIQTILRAMSSLNIYCIRGLYVPQNFSEICSINGSHDADLEKQYTLYCEKTNNLELINFGCDAYIKSAQKLYDSKDVHLKYYIPHNVKQELNEILTDHGLDMLD